MSGPSRPWLPLSDSEKQERLTFFETKPIHGHVLPQVVRTSTAEFKEVSPHEWGLTIAQCRELMALVRQDPETVWDPNWNVEDLVKHYVKPWTAQTGMGYSLLVNAERPCASWARHSRPSA